MGGKGRAASLKNRRREEEEEEEAAESLERREAGQKRGFRLEGGREGGGGCSRGKKREGRSCSYTGKIGDEERKNVLQLEWTEESGRYLHFV